MKLKRYIPVLAIALAACGGGEPADAPPQGGSQPAAAPPASTLAAPPTGAMTTPAWYVVDNTARTVHLTLIAGETAVNNYWNYNGATNGSLAITVPEGYTVTIEQVNRDPNMAHSVGILPIPANFAMPPQPNPVFPGAISQNPMSMIDATMPGETESITFVASEEGNYALVCLIPGHSAVGMWLYFNVADEGGPVGVQTR
ncbi:MAG: sulfocyanin-like copper-binding protein [Gemmatimonadota bacterium]|nr:sulfocyanin-like copper-binding protein [Gemmatimonadota bacterium]